MSKLLPQQWRWLKSDPWLLSLITWVPVVVVVLVWAALSQGIARDLPVGVVDNDQSRLSQTMLTMVDATDTLIITQQYTDVSAAKAAMQAGDIYGYVYVPIEFEKNVLLGHAPQASVFYNSQTMLVGKSINTAVRKAIGTFDATVGVGRNLSQGNTTTLSAMGQTVSVSTQLRSLFNSNNNYAQFLMSAVAPAVWQVVIVVGTLLILAMFRRQHALEPWLCIDGISGLLSRLSLYLPVFWLQGIAFSLWFYQGLQWPFAGSFWTLALAQLLMVISAMSVGALLFLLTMSEVRSMSMAAAFTAPSFAFMGVTFPVSDMPVLAQFWRSIIPASHYIEAQISQTAYASDMMHTLSLMAPTLIYPALLCLFIALLPKHAVKESS